MCRVLILVFVIINFISCSEKLDCIGITEGTFIMPQDTEETKSYKIIRKGDIQKEINDGIETSYSKVEWLNPCSYILKYDESQMELSDFQKEVNQVGGIIVEVTKVKGNCFYYTSNIKGDPPSERINGVMCKE